MSELTQNVPATIVFQPKSLEKPARSLDSGARQLSEIRLDDELAEVYASAKDLLDDILTDSDVPANQRAQVLNSVSSLLQQIAKTRTDLHNAERLRKLEQILLQVMREQPLEVKEAFFESYSRQLGDANV